MKDNISILAISDVHIGCARLNPHLLHQKFIKYVYPQITPDIDLFFVCGDFFDTRLDLNAFAAFESIEIIQELRDICKQNGVDLRILRGTFTHDRNQPRHFVNGIDENDQSVRLFEKMEVELHEKTGLRILYMPDNLVSDDLYEDIRQLLSAHNLDSVDILIHHGYFKHMLPEIFMKKGLPKDCLEIEKIEKYVKGCTLNGHVHVSSIYKNVISIGSFDRLAHGEEGPKGFYKIDISNGVYTFTFIENEDATPFLTFDLQNYDAEGALHAFTERWLGLVDSFLHTPEQNVRVRILSQDKAVIEGCAQIAKSKFKNVIVDQVAVVKHENTIDNVAMNLDDLPQIVPSNLVDLLMPILKKHNPNVDRQVVDEIISTVKMENKV